jgi:Chaperone of endosialidase
LRLENASFGNGVMKKTRVLLTIAVAALTFVPALAEANSGDFSGGVVIGTGYAGINTAPINGLLAQGNVGIGTTSPANNLSISGDGGTGVGPGIIGIAATDAASTGQFVWASSAFDSNLGAGATIVHLIGQAGSTANSGYFGFHYVGSGSSSNYLSFGFYGTNNLMVLTDAGNVGIGTSSPVGQLDLFGTGDERLIIRSTDTSGTYTGYGISSGTGATFEGGMFVQNNNKGVLEFFSSTSTDVMNINGSSVGIGTQTARGGALLDVNGSVRVGSFAAGSSTTVCQNGNILSSCTSALRFKENVKPAQLGLKEVLEMKPVTYDQRNRTSGWERHDFGFVAEEMEKINPIFVTYDENGKINGVRYMQLTAVNAKAIQELQAEIDDLKRTIEELKHQQ